jgi:hypothetical protein
MRVYFKLFFQIFSIYLVLFLTYAFGLITLLSKALNEENMKITTLEHPSHKVSDKLFLKRKSWGITGGNTVALISSSSENINKVDSNSDYIFNSFTLYYKLSNETLFVYNNPLNIKTPPRFKSNFKIIFPKLEGHQCTHDYLIKLGVQEF